MDTTRKIKVLIVDDYKLMRREIIHLLGCCEDIEVVSQTGDAKIILALCAVYQPDVVLLDVLMPHVDGMVATQLIHEQFPTTQIIAISTSSDVNLIADMIAAGAISYIIKDDQLADVVQSIRSAYEFKSGLVTQASDG